MSVRPHTVTRRKPVSPKRVSMYFLLVALTIVFLFPMEWMIAASFRPTQYVMYNVNSWRSLLPIPFTLANYKDIFTQEPFLMFLATSIGYVVVIIPISLLVNGMAAYALARLRFPGRGMLTNFIIALIIIPFEAILLPLYLEMAQFGMINTYWAMIMPFLVNPLIIFLLRQFFLALPRELEESASLDGASVWRTFWSIIVPNSKPAVFAAAFLIFLDRWNDFLWPFISTTSQRYWNVQVGLATFFTQQAQWGNVMAAAFTITIPVYIMFVFFQRYLVEGIATTGIK